MPKKIIATVLALISSAPLGGVGNVKAATCNAPELAGRASYDELVCSGTMSMMRQDYRRAIQLFDRAMEIPLLDRPNFQLYPRLALAYFRVGDREKANALLTKAELSLMLVTRMLNCEEFGSTYIIVRNIWGVSSKIDSPYHDEIASRMCGAAYEAIYHPQKLEEIVGQASLLRNYFDIKAQIDGVK